MGAIIGLTGGIGVGKTTVAQLFKQRGARVVDVDGLGRDVLEPGGGAYDDVIAAFGQGIVTRDGSIDRAALATEVFGGHNRLDELEAISHPAINARLGELLDVSSASLVVLDMAVLVESRLGWFKGSQRYQRVIVVEAPAKVRLARLVARGMTEADARARMWAQSSDRERRARADLVVVNDGTETELDRDVTRLWPTIDAWIAQGRIA